MCHVILTHQKLKKNLDPNRPNPTHGQVCNKRLCDAPIGRVFAARRYASALYAVETTGRMELAFGTEASFSTCVRPSAAAVSAAAMVDGCREEDVGDCSSLACTSAATILVAKLVDIWPPICIRMLSGGSA